MTTDKRRGLRATFGANVKALRRDKRLSQIALARLAGLSDRYIGVIERCDKSATIEVVEAVARALGVEPHQLLMPRHRERAKTSKARTSGS